MEYPYNICKQLVKANLLSSKSVLLLGHPGVGKTSMAKELAQELDLPLVTIHLAHHSPEEIMGGLFPDRGLNINVHLDPEKVHNGYYSNLEENIKKIQQVASNIPRDNQVVHFKPYWVPDKDPAFVFLDEINAGVTKLHQSIAYQIVLEHRVGPFKFHPNTIVMAAGNLEEDNAIVTPLSSALNNRFCHFTLKVSAEAWLEWAAKQELSPDGRSYIAWRGESVLYKNTGERAFPTPRSWSNALEVAPETMVKDEKTKLLRKRLIASWIGEASTNEFFTYLDIYRTVNIDDILERGNIPNFKNSELSFVYANVFALSNHLNNKKIKDNWYPNIANFLNAEGLHADMQAMFFNQLKRNVLDKIVSNLVSNPKFNALASKIVKIIS